MRDARVRHEVFLDLKTGTRHYTAAPGRSPRAEDERVALAAATAQGGGASTAAAAAQFEGEDEDEPGAAHADRVAEGDSAAVDVDLWVPKTFATWAYAQRNAAGVG
jgi:hypothetical protein